MKQLRCGDHTKEPFWQARKGSFFSYVHGHLQNVHGHLQNVHGHLQNVHGQKDNVHGQKDNVHGHFGNVHGHFSRTSEMIFHKYDNDQR
jgi:hypothetical protein